MVFHKTRRDTYTTGIAPYNIPLTNPVRRPARGKGIPYAKIRFSPIDRYRARCMVVM